MHCLDDIGEEELVNFLDAAIGVAKNFVNDLHADNVGDGFSRTLLRTDSGLDSIVAAICFFLCICMCGEGRWYVFSSVCLDFGCRLFGFGEDQ